jgi:2-polyprenyl-3-methyl-5-hydroxy-6-metoxy-1,4-benzoquinol methylase
LVKGPDVLDVGCAGREIAPNEPQWLHGRLREHFNVTGIDVSEHNITVLKKLGFTGLHVQSAETFELKQTFDTIVAGEVIEHLSNPGKFLERSRAHLRPQGRLIISTPNAFSLMYGLYALAHFPKTCENDEHTCWFCPSTIAELAAREGLAIETWRLVDDYSDKVKSFKYRAYWIFARTVGKLLPRRLTKTNMIVVLRCA